MKKKLKLGLGFSKFTMNWNLHMVYNKLSTRGVQRWRQLSTSESGFKNAGSNNKDL